jgi:hypothetical protein
MGRGGPGRGVSLVRAPWTGREFAWGGHEDRPSRRSFRAGRVTAARARRSRDLGLASAGSVRPTLIERLPSRVRVARVRVVIGSSQVVGIGQRSTYEAREAAFVERPVGRRIVRLHVAVTYQVGRTPYGELPRVVEPERIDVPAFCAHRCSFEPRSQRRTLSELRLPANGQLPIQAVR